MRIKGAIPVKLRRMVVAGCIFLALGAVIRLHAQQILVNKDNRTVAVTTTADATADADTATVHIGFIVYGAEQQQAYANGSTVSNAIAAALDDAGVPKEAIQSDSQSIAPVQPYGNQDWTPQEKMERKFQVEQSWTVKTAAKSAARVLDVAVKAGANQSGEIDWSVADENALVDDAAKLALERAKRVAQQIAQGLNSTLGPLVYASNEAPSRSIEPMMRLAAAPPPMAKANVVAPLSINLRKVTRSATVYAVFAIQ